MECLIVSEKDSNFALDVTKKSKKPNAKLQLYKIHGGPNQRFRIEGNVITNVNSGLVLDIEGGEKQGGKLMQYHDHNGPNQRFFLHPDGTIRSTSGQLCLDIQGGSMKNGTPIIAWVSNNQANQKWKIVTKW